MSVVALSFEAVSYRYPGHSRLALCDIDLEIEAGAFCVVAGLSASGKSTLLRAACGLVPHFHGGEFAGRVCVGALDTREHGPAAISAVAGTLFQDPETQVVMTRVRSELAFPLENRGHPPAAVARGVEEVALALGIEGLLERGTAELSGGELQRVALGAALAGRPDIVLLDEPTSQLDPVAGDELVWLLRRLNEEWGTTVVLIEQRLERCLAAADRVIALDHATVAFDGSPSAFQDWAGRVVPALQIPAARLLAQSGLGPAPTGVKQARATLRAHGLPRPDPADRCDPGDHPDDPHPHQRRTRPHTARTPRIRRRRRPLRLGLGPRAADAPPPALAFTNVWHELRDGPALLRGVTLQLAPGEVIALMGRNGAGKSTLLRHARGLMRPTRGRVHTAGPVALLLQNPGDYFLHESVGDEAPPAALARQGLDGLEDRHPRDLSGGQRQRLALAIVLGDDEAAVVALDEPTRGMDRAAKDELAERLGTLARAGAAVVVATHDAELAAAIAHRVVLLADGRVIADAPTAEVLSGGWYFATETARVLGGHGAVLLPDEGAELLRAQLIADVIP